MKNSFFNFIKSRIQVSITGNNINRFILRLNKNNINIYSIKNINTKKVIIIINYSDFDKLLKLNTIYEINIDKYLGFEKNKRIFFKYYHVILFLIVGIIFVYLVSNIVFSVEIITTDLDMRKKLTRTLSNYDLSKFHFKKSFNYINNVKEKILEEYHDEIEWIEIETKGTKYIVRYEPRIIKSKEESKGYRSIVAKKNCIIRKISASEGQITKDISTYVKKGEEIVSGYIYMDDNFKDTVSATGNVYGEVWYETRVVYPFNYYEEKRTGIKKNVLAFNFFNKRIELFNLKPFNDKIVLDRYYVRNKILPISFVFERQEKILVKTGMNVVEIAKIKALNMAYEKMNTGLKDDEYIIDYKVLESKIIDKGVEMKIFFSILENVSEYQSIPKIKEVE
jgi:similar to stage IV sporulation protein